MSDGGSEGNDPKTVPSQEIRRLWDEEGVKGSVKTSADEMLLESPSKILAGANVKSVKTVNGVLAKGSEQDLHSMWATLVSAVSIGTPKGWKVAFPVVWPTDAQNHDPTAMSAAPVLMTFNTRNMSTGVMKKFFTERYGRPPTKVANLIYGRMTSILFQVGQSIITEDPSTFVRLTWMYEEDSVREELFSVTPKQMENYATSPSPSTPSEYAVKSVTSLYFRALMTDSPSEADPASTPWQEDNVLCIFTVVDAADIRGESYGWSLRAILNRRNNEEKVTARIALVTGSKDDNVAEAWLSVKASLVPDNQEYIGWFTDARIDNTGLVEWKAVLDRIAKFLNKGVRPMLPVPKGPSAQGSGANLPQKPPGSSGGTGFIPPGKEPADLKRPLSRRDGVQTSQGFTVYTGDLTGKEPAKAKEVSPTMALMYLMKCAVCQQPTYAGFGEEDGSGEHIEATTINKDECCGGSFFNNYVTLSLIKRLDRIFNQTKAPE